MKKYKINIIKWNLEKYNSSPLFYEKFQILLLMENANTHLVSLFKDYLLYDDSTEFLKDYYYKNKEIYQRLKTIYDYYESSSYLFPNYTAINEGKYIYRNIIKKQKLIDYLEDLEDKKKDKENKKKKNENLNLYQNEQSSSFFDVFNTRIYNNIIKETGNDSKINELFCVGNNGNIECGDSIASILKLTEEMKENNKEIKDNKKESKEKDKKDINSNNNKNMYNNNNKKHKNNNINLNNINNKLKNKIQTKIYVSRRINVNSNKVNNNSKKIFKKPKVNININNILNNNFNNLNSNNYTQNYYNRNQIVISDTNKTNDYLKSNFSYINNNKNNYKKNNIIINIINNNKTNNYQSNINYFSNNTSNSPNNIQHDNKSNALTSDNSKYNSINNKKYSTKNSNIYYRHNTTIKDKSELKSVIVKYSQNHSKKISKKKIKKDNTSKLLSFRLTTEKNLTERIKFCTSKSKLNTGKDLSKNKSLISPRNKVKKRTKTELLGYKKDIFILGQPNEINTYNYNKSINRQILKNINLTNSNKPHKDISLINKKIIKYHFGINSSKIDKKCVKHISTNSQNLTGIKILTKVSPLPLKEIIKKKIGIFSFNNTERISRNHSKEESDKHLMSKGNYLDSFSPKKNQDEVYKKMKKIHNKKSAIISSFLKNIGSNKKIKGDKNNKRKNNSNNITYKGISTIINSKELFNRATNDKNF